VNSAERKIVPVPADLHDSKNQLALLSWIQDFAPYGIITLDRAFQIQIWNHWMEMHSSVPAAEVMGKNLLAVFPDLQERKLVTHFERALEGESSVLSSSLHRYLLPVPSPLRETGGPVNMLQTARISPLLAGGVVCGIVIVIEDVTQRESQAQILHHQHRRDQILSGALAHFLNTEEPRNIVRQLFFKIAEHLDFDTFVLYLRDVETGQLCLHTTGGVPPNLETELAADPLLADAANSPDIVVYDAVQTRTGTRFEALKKAGVSAAIAIPLLANNRPLGLLCFGTWNRASIAPDESELLNTIAQYLATAIDRENTGRQLRKVRLQLHEHAHLLEKKVQERTARLQETISELETFSYTVAHDLKAPVRGMIGYCGVLLEDFGDTLPPGAKQIVERMARTPRRMEALIRDLLQFTEISRQEIVLTGVEVGPIVEDVLTMRLPEVRDFTTILTPLHPVRANRTLLQQVLSNLVDNAVKFVEPQASPKITIGTEVVAHTTPSTRSTALVFSSVDSREAAVPTASEPEKQTCVRIWIRDEGIGIPSGVHQKIFGIFERGNFSERYEGTGMGLAIVARAMQRMGGTCGVESEPGHGSRFWVELPAA
jgi:PAS domain S-box-containing protein